MKHTINIEKTRKAMNSMAKQAIAIIRREARTLVAEEKQAYEAGEDDFVTNGDRTAQAMYVRRIRKEFPTFGLIAEEKELTIPCTHPTHNIYFTVDPLDGTKAYIRRQSHGVATMIALVLEGKVVATVIGDVNSGDIYEFADSAYHPIGAPADAPATRTRFGNTTPLTIETGKLLSKQYALLRERPEIYPTIVRKIIKPAPKGGLFKDMEVAGASIGACVARLWKGEVGAIFTKPGMDTPWDVTPVYGLCFKLGFRFFRFGKNGKKPELYVPELITKVTPRDHYQLIVHKSRVAEVEAWLATQGKE